MAIDRGLNAGRWDWRAYDGAIFIQFNVPNEDLTGISFQIKCDALANSPYAMTVDNVTKEVTVTIPEGDMNALSKQRHQYFFQHNANGSFATLVAGYLLKVA